jgi:excisionase family DNA binding protein
MAKNHKKKRGRTYFFLWHPTKLSEEPRRFASNPNSTYSRSRRFAVNQNHRRAGLGAPGKSILETCKVALGISQSGRDIEMNEFLDVDQFAKMFSLSRAWVYKMVWKGKISHYKIGNRVFFRKEDIDQFIERSRVECQLESEKVGPVGTSSIGTRRQERNTSDTEDRQKETPRWRNVS